jgi:hypothetical protein
LTTITAVGEYVRRAAVAGLSWPIPDEKPERRLFPLADAGSERRVPIRIGRTSIRK